jgi:hypothetical protein
LTWRPDSGSPTRRNHRPPSRYSMFAIISFPCALLHTPLPLTPPRKRRLPERKRKNETKTRKAYEDEVLQVLCRVHSVLLAVSKRRMRTRKKEGSM